MGLWVLQILSSQLLQVLFYEGVVVDLIKESKVSLLRRWHVETLSKIPGCRLQGRPPSPAVQRTGSWLLSTSRCNANSRPSLRKLMEVPTKGIKSASVSLCCFFSLFQYNLQGLCYYFMCFESLGCVFVSQSRPFVGCFQSPSADDVLVFYGIFVLVPTYNR